MKRLPLLLTLLLPLLAGCKSTVVTIVDENRLPVANAMILASNSVNQFQEFQSTQDGTFNFASLEGRHRIATIRAAGYFPKTIKLDTTPNVTLVRITEAQQESGLAEIDSDRDGLSDLEEPMLGLHPLDPDTDADGLPDGIESHVSRPISLVSLGVNPIKRDILLEIDWEEEILTSKVTDVGIQLAQKAFKNAPVNNPDGSQGVNLIVDQGQFGGGSGTYSLDTLRLPYFYHMGAESGHVYGNYNGWGEFNGRLTWINGDFPHYGVAEPFIEAYLLLHELGHNLGLDHGGYESTPCKPNYFSVMSYNPLMALGFTYSRGLRPPLDEANLNESEGIGKGPVDWNLNYRIDDNWVEADIDGYTPASIIQHIIELVQLDELEGEIGYLFSAERCAVNGNIGVHHDHDDFASIAYYLDQFLPDAMRAISKDGQAIFQRTANPTPRVIYDNLQVEGIFEEIARKLANQPEN